SSRRTTARTSGGGRGPGPGGARRALVPPARIGDPSTRHRLLISIILVAVLALSGRLICVQGLDASARAEEALAQRTVTRTIPAPATLLARVMRATVLPRTARAPRVRDLHASARAGRATAHPPAPRPIPARGGAMANRQCTTMGSSVEPYGLSVNQRQVDQYL